MVYMTGFIASPFMILLSLPFGVAYFLDHDRRAVVRLAVLSVAWLSFLFAVWWLRDAEVAGWNAHAYPWYTALVLLFQLFAIVGTAAQAIDLPDSLIASLARQEAELERQAHRAALGTSLAVIAHEIRSPLTTMTFSLRAALDQLKSPEGPGATRALRHLQSTEEELGRVNRILEGLLSYAREKRGRMRPALHRPLVLFNRAVEFVQLTSDPRSVPAEAETQTSRLVRCDADAMHQVLVNLLDNAIRHSAPDRKLRVHMRAVDRGEEVALIVRDNGTGIPPGRIGRLFEQYSTDRPDGTGLGLSIARQLVRDQGGTIAVEETSGGGATFVITLAAASETTLESPEDAL
jgi:signal transduction histidine kinase